MSPRTPDSEVLTPQHGNRHVNIHFTPNFPKIKYPGIWGWVYAVIYGDDGVLCITIYTGVGIRRTNMDGG